MILRIDLLQTELPPPEADPVGASAVQGLLGGKYDEMSTFMNYMYQSFNFRSRQGARPFYEPWSGDYVFASGDLIDDLTLNFFLETGARNDKVKVYEMVEHRPARVLTGYLLVRGVHQVTYGALERLTGADLIKLFPPPRMPTDRIPEGQPHVKRGEHLKLSRFSPTGFQEIKAVSNGPHPETGEDLMVAKEVSPEGAPAFALPSQPAVFAPDLTLTCCPKSRPSYGKPPDSPPPTGLVANNGKGTSVKGVVDKVKDAVS